MHVFNSLLAGHRPFRKCTVLKNSIDTRDAQFVIHLSFPSAFVFRSIVRSFVHNAPMGFCCSNEIKWKMTSGCWLLLIMADSVIRFFYSIFYTTLFAFGNGLTVCSQRSINNDSVRVASTHTHNRRRILHLNLRWKYMRMNACFPFYIRPSTAAQQHASTAVHVGRIDVARRAWNVRCTPADFFIQYLVLASGLVRTRLCSL